MLNVLFVLGYLFLLGYIFTVLKRNRGKLLTEDEIQINSKWITTASLLAALTAILHSAPVFFPVIGLALSPLSSIPIIIGALLFADRVLPMFLAATVLLFLINVGGNDFPTSYGAPWIGYYSNSSPDHSILAEVFNPHFTINLWHSPFSIFSRGAWLTKYCGNFKCNNVFGYCFT